MSDCVKKNSMIACRVFATDSATGASASLDTKTCTQNHTSALCYACVPNESALLIAKKYEAFLTDF